MVTELVVETYQNKCFANSTKIFTPFTKIPKSSSSSPTTETFKASRADKCMWTTLLPQAYFASNLVELEMFYKLYSSNVIGGNGQRPTSARQQTVGGFSGPSQSGTLSPQTWPKAAYVTLIADKCEKHLTGRENRRDFIPSSHECRVYKRIENGGRKSLQTKRALSGRIAQLSGQPRTSTPCIKIRKRNVSQVTKGVNWFTACHFFWNAKNICEHMARKTVFKYPITS